MAKDFYDLLKKYNGKNPFVQTVRDKANQGAKVSDLQEKICWKVFREEERAKKKEKTKELANDSRKLTLKNKKEGKHKDTGIYAYPETQNLSLSFTPQDTAIPYLRSPKDWHYESINFLLKRNRAILGDDLGLGKTYSSLLAGCESEARTWLIVVPASLQSNWAAEIRQTIPQSYLNNCPVNLIGENKKLDYKLNCINIISYSSLDRIKDTILSLEGLDLLIADEAHNIKNPKSKRSKLFALVSKLAKRCWLLTGTPVSKRPMDLFHLLKISRHKLGDNMINFGMTYCGAKYNGFGWNFLGCSNVDKLVGELRNVYLRRNKKDVANLPMKTSQNLVLTFPSKAKKKYSTLVEDYINAVKKEVTKIQHMNLTNASQLIEASLVNRFLSMQKIEDGTLKELCDAFIEQGKKVIIFTQYTESLEKSLEIFSKDYGTSYIKGGMKMKELDDNKEKFNFDPNTQIMVANLTAGSTGHTLVGNTSETGTVTIFLDISNKPFLHKQAEDRSYRIGQEKPVDIFYLIYQDSLEEKDFVLLQKSFKVMDSINELTGMSKEELENMELQANSLANDVYKTVSLSEYFGITL